MATNFSYESIANKIRTKLLLFIDQEIQSKIKQKKLFYNPQLEEKRSTILYSNINKMYSNHENTFYISFAKFKDKISKNQIKLKKNRHSSQESLSTCFATSKTKAKIFQNRNLKNIPVYYGSPTKKINIHNDLLSFNNIINIKENFYAIKKELKLSSTFQIYKKPKTDKKYLKKLCDSLKIMKKYDVTFHRNVKSRLSSVVHKVNRGESSPIKRAVKKQSCRIRSNINNLRF